MVTIKDIAKESGYSVSTVSRVLNKRRDVSPEAKKKIEQVVAAYNFVPNNNAKHLKQNVSRTIVLLVKGTSNMLFADIVEEIQRMIEKTNYTAVVSYLDEDENEVLLALQICRERKPLGILFLGGNPQFFQDDFAQIEVPSVLVTTQAQQMHFALLSSVATDDISAAECAVDFLISRGHTKIGVIGGDFNSSFTSRQRFLGCQKSFEKSRIPFDREKLFEKARFSFDSAYKAMERMLKKAPDITAVFAMSDVMAIGAIRALIDQKKRVPDDISVIGFDGTTLADYYNPKLATIKQQHKTLANRSVEILFNLIELKLAAVHEIVPFGLVEGESVKLLRSAGEKL